jgi:outer membrane protein assembly factor BamA
MKSLAAYLAAVEAIYYGEGFENAQVTSELTEGKKDKLELEVLLEEGRRAVVKEVAVRGVSDEHVEDVREELAVEAGAPLAAVTLNEAAVRVGDYYNDRGYGPAKVKV